MAGFSRFFSPSPTVTPSFFLRAVPQPPLWVCNHPTVLFPPSDRSNES